MALCVAELEDDEEHVINWSVEMTDVLGSRLYALWNRTAGDCLLDSVLQASWGVMDRDNTLRRALADSLNEAAFTYDQFFVLPLPASMRSSDGSLNNFRLLQKTVLFFQRVTV